MRRLHWDHDQIAQHQLHQTNRVLRHAASCVPLYRDRLPAAPLRSLHDLRALPVIERADLLAVPIDDRRGTAVTDRTLTKVTSGTSGHYLSVELSARAAWWQGILAVRRDWARGVRPWERTVAIRVGRDPRPRVGALGAMARRSTTLRAESEAASLAADLLAIDPVVVSGFGHQLLDVAAALDGRLRPRVVGTGGQMLSAADRDRLADGFGVRPLDLYGAVEVGAIAWQCAAADLYHLDHDSVVLEVLDEHGDPAPAGEAGEAVVTSLENLHMPLVRYRLRDRVRLAERPCRCGVRGPAIEEIEGREMDRFRCADGTRVASSRLFLSAHVPDTPRWVRRYRVIQDTSGRVWVEVVPVAALPDGFEASVVAAYRSVLGPVDVSVETVGTLPADASGKLRQFSVAGDAVPAGSDVR